MKEPEIPADEPYRLAALQSLNVLDTPPEEDFDTIVALARELFDVPICLVTLIDADRQWFKACIGLSYSEGPRALSFCGHAILSEEAMVILDATKDERFFDNPAVTGPPNVRFYAGMPIRLPSGYQIGTVCLVDTQPRAAFGEQEGKTLKRLADMAVNAMALRGLRRELDAARMSADRMRTALALLPTPVAIADTGGEIEEANPAFADLCRADPLDGGSVADLLAVPPDVWESATSAADEGEVRTGTDGKLLRVVPDAGGMILVGKLEPEADA